MGNFIISFLVVDEAHVKGLLPSFAVLQDEFVYHELLLTSSAGLLTPLLLCWQEVVAV